MTNIPSLEESVKKASLVLGTLTALAAAISTAHAAQDVLALEGRELLTRRKTT